MSNRAWCVASQDRDETGRVTGLRWCRLERQVRGRAPEYRDNERTACCGMWVTLPCGYELREPTCDSPEPADEGTVEP